MPLACSNAVPTSKLLIHRLNMTHRYHEDRYFHKILSEIGYCGLDPRINPLCSVLIKFCRPLNARQPAEGELMVYKRPKLELALGERGACLELTSFEHVHALPPSLPIPTSPFSFSPHSLSHRQMRRRLETGLVMCSRGSVS